MLVMTLSPGLLRRKLLRVPTVDPADPANIAEDPVDPVDPGHSNMK